jgi:hypothetical protein
VTTGSSNSASRRKTELRLEGRTAWIFAAVRTEGDCLANGSGLEGRLDSNGHEFGEHVVPGCPIFDSLEVTIEAASDIWKTLINGCPPAGLGNGERRCQPAGPAPEI